MTYERVTIYVCKGKRDNGSQCNAWHIDTSQFEFHTDGCNECCEGCKQCDPDGENEQ